MAAATMQYAPLIGETTAAEASAAPPRSASKLSGTDIERQERGIHAVELAGHHPGGRAKEERGHGEHRRDHPGHHDRSQRRTAASAGGHQAQQGDEPERGDAQADAQRRRVRPQPGSGKPL